MRLSPLLPLLVLCCAFAAPASAVTSTNAPDSCWDPGNCTNFLMKNPRTNLFDGSLVCMSQQKLGGPHPLPGRPPPVTVLNKIDASDGQGQGPSHPLGTPSTYQDDGEKCGGQYTSTNGFKGTMTPILVPNPYTDLLGGLPEGAPAMIPNLCGYYKVAYTCPATSTSP